MPIPNRKKRHWFVSAALILAVIVILLTLRLVEDIGVERLPGERFTVVRVIDGDTVELLGGDRLRLLAIDTPERGERFYDQASKLLESVTLGKKARVEYSRNRRDKYGRLLGFLYVDDTIFANKMIIDSGLGCLFLFSDQDLSNQQTKELLTAQREAFEQKRGLWGLEQKSEDFYVSIKNTFRFHRPGCTIISGKSPESLRNIETRKQALFEGLSPCRTCRP